MRKHLAAGAMLMLGGGLTLANAMAWAAESPNLGHPATEAEISAWDISIGPDGKGLPPGSGTPKQGEAVFAQKCMGCHGAKGVGGPNDRLAGGQGTLVGDQTPVKTVGSYWPYATTLFDYIRRAMPLPQPQSLSNDEVYSLAAYILNLNGLVGDKEKIDATNLAKVKMPNRANFFQVYPGNLK